MITIVFVMRLSLVASLDKVQFYDQSTTLGAAIASTVTDNGTQFLMQISAPISYGWVAIGSDHKMDKSIMFVIFPSADGKRVTLSPRSTTQHYAPSVLPRTLMTARVTSSDITNGRMTANIMWWDPDWMLGSKIPNKTPINILNDKQPFIWAVGPSQPINADDISITINKHSDHGVIFVDMQASQNPPEKMRAPAIEGTANIGVQSQPHYYHKFIFIHTVLLTSAFVLVFPFGVIGLRWNIKNKGFTVHWIFQCIACLAMLPGLGIGIAMSILGIQFNNFMQPHQLVGMAVCLLVPLQAYLGRSHAIRFKVHKKRTLFTYFHFALGRLIIWGGTGAAVLGLILCGRGYPVIVCAAVGGALAIIQEGFAIRAYLKARKKNALDARLKGYTLGSGEYSKLKDVSVTERELDGEGEDDYHMHRYSDRRDPVESPKSKHAHKHSAKLKIGLKKVFHRPSGA